jgi:hypothetical protein
MEVADSVGKGPFVPGDDVGYGILVEIDFNIGGKAFEDQLVVAFELYPVRAHPVVDVFGGGG